MEGRWNYNKVNGRAGIVPVILAEAQGYMHRCDLLQFIVGDYADLGSGPEVLPRKAGDVVNGVLQVQLKISPVVVVSR